MIPCIRSGCGHDYEDQHSPDAYASERPCIVSGCGCPDGVLDGAGLLTWLKERTDG